MRPAGGQFERRVVRASLIGSSRPKRFLSISWPISLVNEIGHGTDPTHRGGAFTGPPFTMGAASKAGGPPIRPQAAQRAPPPFRLDTHFALLYRLFCPRLPLASPDPARPSQRTARSDRWTAARRRRRPLAFPARSPWQALGCQRPTAPRSRWPRERFRMDATPSTRAGHIDLRPRSPLDSCAIRVSTSEVSVKPVTDPRLTTAHRGRPRQRFAPPGTATLGTSRAEVSSVVDSGGSPAGASNDQQRER